MKKTDYTFGTLEQNYETVNRKVPKILELKIIQASSNLISLFKSKLLKKLPIKYNKLIPFNPIKFPYYENKFL